MDRDVPLKLVVLSACRTAKAQSFATHIGGFVYALFHLGARFMVVSIQETDDNLSR